MRVFGQRSRPKGARRGKQVRRAHQMPFAPTLPGVIVGHDGDVRDSAWRFGRVAQADDWSTHRRSLPREIFKLASTWLIPGCDVLESGCDSRVGRYGEVQNPARDAQLSWCSSLGYYQAPAALNPRSWTVRPRERHRQRQLKTIPTPRAAATAAAKWGRVVVVNCRESSAGQQGPKSMFPLGGHCAPSRQNKTRF